jgi:hypothetical protein
MQQDNKTKSMKTVPRLLIRLAMGQKNQREFLTSVQVVSAQMKGMSFLSRARSRWRLASRSDIMNMGANGVKNETKNAEQYAGTGSAAAPLDIEDFMEQPLGHDDVEAAMMGNFPIWLAVGSTEPESAEDTAVRMSLYNQLLMAAPDHGHKTRTCQPGDCYQFMKLILKDIRVGKQSRYLTVIALAEVKFPEGMTISELVTSLKDVQTNANRLKEGAIDDELMVGALLSLAQGHKLYEQLATDFSKPSSTLSYEAIVDHLREHEQNHSRREPKVGGPASSVSDPAAHRLANLLNGGTAQDEPSELAALVSRVLAVSREQAASPHGPEGKDSEVCRDFRRGSCARAAADCIYSHGDSGQASAACRRTNDRGGERKAWMCYNCRRLGFHYASECKEERWEPREEAQLANEQAPQVARGGASSSGSINIAAFMEELQSQAVPQRDLNWYGQ